MDSHLREKIEKHAGMQAFQFTIFPVENGYRLRVNCGAAEYLWPEIFSTLQKAGKEILRALTTASECQGEIRKKVRRRST
jgi:hypothetical protein